MLPSETMIWQPEFTDKTLSRKPGAVQKACAGKEPEDGIYILSEEDNTSLSVELVTELSPLDYDKLSKLLPSLDTLCGA